MKKITNSMEVTLPCTTIEAQMLNQIVNRVQILLGIGSKLEFKSMARGGDKLDITIKLFEYSPISPPSEIGGKYGAISECFTQCHSQNRPIRIPDGLTTPQMARNYARRFRDEAGESTTIMNKGGKLFCKPNKVIFSCDEIRLEVARVYEQMAHHDWLAETVSYSTVSSIVSALNTKQGSKCVSVRRLKRDDGESVIRVKHAALEVGDSPEKGFEENEIMGDLEAVVKSKVRPLYQAGGEKRQAVVLCGPSQMSAVLEVLEGLNTKTKMGSGMVISEKTKQGKTVGYDVQREDYVDDWGALVDG